eukprot:4575011-Prymnesium_polylepis.1
MKGMAASRSQASGSSRRAPTSPARLPPTQPCMARWPGAAALTTLSIRSSPAWRHRRSWQHPAAAAAGARR